MIVNDFLLNDYQLKFESGSYDDAAVTVDIANKDAPISG